MTLICVGMRRFLRKEKVDNFQFDVIMLKEQIQTKTDE
jgi:hypothetical protein